MRTYDEEAWTRVRARGRGAFLLRTGVLGRGLPMGVVTALAIQVYLGGPLPDAFLAWTFAGRLLLAVAVFSVSGCVAANANWNLHERRYAVRPKL